MLGRIRFGANKAEYPVSMVRGAGPDFLSVQDLPKLSLLRRHAVPAAAACVGLVHDDVDAVPKTVGYYYWRHRRDIAAE